MRTFAGVLTLGFVCAFCMEAAAQPLPSDPGAGGGASSGSPAKGGKGGSGSKSGGDNRPEAPPEITGPMVVRLQLDGILGPPLDIRPKLEKQKGVMAVAVNDKLRTVTFQFSGSFLGLKAAVNAISTDKCRAVLIDPVRFDLKMQPKKSGSTIKSKEIAQAFTTLGARVVKNLGDGDLAIYISASARPMEIFARVANEYECKVKIESHEQLEFKVLDAESMDMNQLYAFQTAVNDMKGVLTVEFDPATGKLVMLCEAKKVKRADLAKVLEPFKCRLPEEEPKK